MSVNPFYSNFCLHAARFEMKSPPREEKKKKIKVKGYFRLEAPHRSRSLSVLRCGLRLVQRDWQRECSPDTSLLMAGDRLLITTNQCNGTVPCHWAWRKVERQDTQGNVTLNLWAKVGNKMTSTCPSNRLWKKKEKKRVKTNKTKREIKGKERSAFFN